MNLIRGLMFGIPIALALWALIVGAVYLLTVLPPNLIPVLPIVGFCCFWIAADFGLRLTQRAHD